nr:uncharacterized protein LOC117693135 [Crassostrea gigas]
MFGLQLGTLSLEKEIVVADIQDEMLFGVDILQNLGEEKADILLSKGVIRFQGHEIPCIQRGMQAGITLRCVERSEIPGNTEVIIPIFIQRAHEEDICDDLLFEPSEDLMERTSLLMAQSIVNVRGKMTVPLRILNPFDETKVLHPDTVVGTVDEFFGVLRRVEQVDNLTEIRRCFSELPGDRDSRSDVVSNHLMSLYEASSQLLSETEKETFTKFLRQYQETFSKDEWDLGQTDLMEHEIDTGDSKPIKQPPRKVPKEYVWIIAELTT